MVVAFAAVVEAALAVEVMPVVVAASLAVGATLAAVAERLETADTAVVDPQSRVRARLERHVSASPNQHDGSAYSHCDESCASLSLHLHLAFYCLCLDFLL